MDPTLEDIECILLDAAKNNLKVLCFAMRAVQEKFLFPNSQYTTLCEFVEARGEALQLPFAGRQASLYATATTVFEDLDSFTIQPTSISHIRALLPYRAADRVRVWEVGVTKYQGTSNLTREKLKEIGDEIAAERRRRQPNGELSVISSQAGLGVVPAIPLYSGGRTTQTRTTNALDFFRFAETDLWGTPDSLLEPSRTVLGGISLDPFSDEYFNRWVKATSIFTVRDNGYNKDWYGTVFLNPPGGTVLGQSNNGLAFRKARIEYESGRIIACICLLKAAIGYRWFQDVYSYPVCFLYERPIFRPATGPAFAASPHGYVVVYLGNHAQLFKTTFEHLGKVYSVGE